MAFALPGFMRCLGAFGSALLATGCAGSDPAVTIVNGGTSCVDDSLHCVGARQSALRQMVADKDKTWVRDRPTPASYASGVRLFAFKSKKKDLSCDELAIGRREADGATSALGGGVGGLTPAQISRGKMFAAEVSRELGNEMNRRCRKS